MEQEITAYLQHLKVLGRSNSQINGMRYSCEKLINYLGNEHQVQSWREVDEQQLTGFSGWLAKDYRQRNEQEIAGHSLVRWISCMRCFFAWLQRSRRLLHNPAEQIELPKRYQQEIEVLSEQEIAQIIEMPDTTTKIGLRDRALMELLYATGVRISEARALDLYDISLQQEEITVRQGKGNKGRMLPLTAQACDWIDNYIREARPRLAAGKYSIKKRLPCAALWLSSQNTRITRDGMNKRIQIYAEQAGLSATAHSFRHAFATHLLRGGANIEAIKLLLGHEDIYTTQIYTQVAFADLQQIIKDEETE